jgi:hypothetical protein
MTHISSNIHLPSLRSGEPLDFFERVINIEKYDTEHIISKEIEIKRDDSPDNWYSPSLRSGESLNAATDVSLNYKVIYSKVNKSFEYNPYPEYSSIILTPENELLCIFPPSVVSYENCVSQENSKYCVKMPTHVTNGVISNLLHCPAKNDIDYFSVYFTQNYLISPLIEGTMISLFYDFRIQRWEISTRTSIGGNYWFTRTQYTSPFEESQKTFREMFFDVIGTDDLEHYFSMYNKDYCYNFILQHPNNHIVLQIEYPQLFIVSIYDVRNTSPARNEEDKCIKVNMIHPQQPFIVEHMLKYNNIYFANPYFPLEFGKKSTERSAYVAETKNTMNFKGDTEPMTDETTHLRDSPERSEGERPKEFAGNLCANDLYGEMRDQFYNILKKTSEMYPMGIMITCINTGKQTAILNENYEFIKNIRGNNPNLQYHFFQLRKNNKINEFLNYFPKYKKAFHQFSKQYQDFVTTTHQHYFNYYVKKEREQLIEKKFFIHVAKIHNEIYIQTKNVVKRSTVLEYFDKMSPSQLLYYTVKYPETKRFSLVKPISENFDFDNNITSDK